MSITKKAVRDAQEVSRLAVDSARNEIIEALTPALRKIVNNRLKGGKLAEDVDRLRRAADGHGETEFEEGKDMAKHNEDDLDMESLEGMFPNVSEVSEEDGEELEEKHAEPDGDECDIEVKLSDDDEEEDMEEIAIPQLGEADEGDMDEEIEISEAELAKFFREGLQLEVQVSKGFKEMTPTGEVEDLDPAAGIADVKSGEHLWTDEEPPAKKDWTMKESVKALIRKGLAENKRLQKENAALRRVASAMKTRLSESNLFNAKVLHINKFMNNHRLKTEQKKAVIEAIDTAKSISEVKRAYSMLESTLRASGVVSESKTARRANTTSSRGRTSGDADKKVLRESVDRESDDNKFARMRQLAGILPNGGR